MKRLYCFILVAGDVLALLLFVAIGQRDHDIVNPENPVGGLLFSASVFILPWLVVGWLVGAFAIGGDKSGDRDAAGPINGRAIIWRALNAWLIAAPLAILLRAALFDRPIIPTLFMFVVMGLGGAFVMAWRLLFLLVVWRLQKRAPATKTAESG